MSSIFLHCISLVSIINQLTMKTTIFLIISSLAIISAKPSADSETHSVTVPFTYNENTINCYIVHLKKKSFFTEYDPVPTTNTLEECEQSLETHKQTVISTYLDLFNKNKNTADYAQCLVDKFIQTDGADLVLLNLVYENARNNDSIDGKTFCKLSNEAKTKIEEYLSESYKSCNPGSEFGNVFTFHSECNDPKH
ncbi:hypothetical protein PVAND_008013 [Polypedilum vanderplanki]|uniref:Uncharacterized protein n=1 Tax=Polypedilum vanderplanki TaxID=319348 RepID=A0A9J6C8X5_POLVA|nr:hypothetical protein PVAND_008013 [Polypedilum vanderplanki]